MRVGIPWYGLMAGLPFGTNARSERCSPCSPQIAAGFVDFLSFLLSSSVEHNGFLFDDFEILREGRTGNFALLQIRLPDAGDIWGWSLRE